MNEDNKDEIIVQLKARIQELEIAMYELSKSAFTVIKYFAEKKHVTIK